MQCEMSGLPQQVQACPHRHVRSPACLTLQAYLPPLVRHASVVCCIITGPNGLREERPPSGGWGGLQKHMVMSELVQVQVSTAVRTKHGHTQSKDPSQLPVQLKTCFLTTATPVRTQQQGSGGVDQHQIFPRAQKGAPSEGIAPAGRPSALPLLTCFALLFAASPGGPLARRPTRTLCHAVEGIWTPRTHSVWGGEGHAGQCGQHTPCVDESKHTASVQHLDALHPACPSPPPAGHIPYTCMQHCPLFTAGF